MNDTLLQKRIMRQVCWSCYLKRFINPVSVKVYALIILAIAIVKTVSISNVIANTAEISNLNGLYYFYISAFSNTEIFVQALIIASLVFLVWLLKDIFFPRTNLI